MNKKLGCFQSGFRLGHQTPAVGIPFRLYEGEDVKELEFYAHNPEIAHTALQALSDSRTWQRSWTSTLVQDPNWEKATPVVKLLPPASA
ncbi:hypothetical protein [Massilia cavernae]|uniref:Uncharacterized protein n=1 Tax=Massilia cavernae TaxID=2320864 RepID=A0A418XAL4_9BURK|nr:hypothetical protein [Massilia cavernae]RJG09535.1 hypothetical protein D3872_22250 [Massilia cavernae]